MLVVGTFVLLNDEYQQLGKHIAAGSGFVANLALWRESGYFDNSGATKPLLHLWSLGVEEQFYLFWPLVLLIAWWCGWNLFWVVCTVAVISFGLNVAIVQNHPVATFYLPATRFWELMLGALLAVTTPRQKLGPLGPARNVVAFAGAGLIGIGLVTVSQRDLYPGWWALLPTLGTALLIAAGERAAINRSILSSRLLVGIGLISYPLYLWHWPLFSFARIIEGGASPPVAMVSANSGKTDLTANHLVMRAGAPYVASASEDCGHGRRGMATAGRSLASVSRSVVWKSVPNGKADHTTIAFQKTEVVVQ